MPHKYTLRVAVSYLRALIETYEYLLRCTTAHHYLLIHYPMFATIDGRVRLRACHILGFNQPRVFSRVTVYRSCTAFGWRDRPDWCTAFGRGRAGHRCARDNASMLLSCAMFGLWLKAEAWTVVSPCTGSTVRAPFNKLCAFTHHVV